MYRFNVLGDLEVWSDGRSCTPSAPKVRAVLALLLLRTNRIVTMDALFEELWGENLPRSATTTTQTYIYQLRRTFERNGTAPGEDLLITRPPGYLLRIDPEQLDAYVFERMVNDGSEFFQRGEFARAAEVLRGALKLWHGPVLAGTRIGRMLETHTASLAEIHMRAMEMRLDADIRLGRYRELIPELRSLVSSHPLNEWLHARLIHCLSQCGRRGEALGAYDRLRHILSDELGLDPAPELQRLQADVLKGMIAPMSGPGTAGHELAAFARAV